MFKFFKEEIFFLKRLFEEGFVPKYLFGYLKNRFSGVNQIASLPVCNCKVRDDLELHVLCQKKDLWMLTWSLKSFMFFSNLCPKIVVHDDGSIDDNSAHLLKTKFVNLEVLTKSEADKLFCSQAWLTPDIIKHRENGHKLIHKLLDVFLTGNAENIIVLDSDVLFFNKPLEITEFLSNPDSKQALVTQCDGSFEIGVSDSYSRELNLIEKRANFINSGLVIFKKSILNKKNLLDYFDNIKRLAGDYLVEMAGWACLLSQTNFKFLPIDKYKIKGKVDEGTVVKHFTNPRRYELYAYGVDMVKKKIASEFNG